MSMAIHKALYHFCHKQFRSALQEGVFEAPDIIYNMPHHYPLLYRYPSNYDVLCDVSGQDMNTLKKLGWIEPMFGKNFVIWFRSDDKAQLVPINIENCTMEKIGSLSLDYPFAYRLIKAQEKSLSELVVIDSPVHAAILNDYGLRAVATGGKFLHQSHARHLSSISANITYLNIKDSVDAAASFVKELGHLKGSVFICMIDSWEALYEETDILSYVANTRIDGGEFLAKRIIDKRRTKLGVTISEELVSSAQHLHPNLQQTFADTAKSLDHSLNDEYLIAHALAFASNLMLGDVTINDALAITRKRFGVDVYFRKSKACEIIRETRTN
jgi:hypothetical protein